MFPDIDLAEWALKPFQSEAEKVAAMRRPEYRDPLNEAYRQAVYNKIDITETNTVSVRVGARELRHELNSTAAPNSEVGRTQAEEIRLAGTTAAEVFGASAVQETSLVSVRVGAKEQSHQMNRTANAPLPDSDGWEAAERRL